MGRQTGRLESVLSLLTVAALVLVVAGGVAQGRTLSAVTPTPWEVWSGRIVSVTEDLSLSGSVLRVSVVGLKGLPVKVYTPDGAWSATGFTGSKTEFGEYAVEFAALSRGNYVVEPQGLGTSLPFYADSKSYITVEFTKGPVVTATPVTSPPPSPTRPLPTWTPVSSPTPRPTATQTFTPVPSTPTRTPEPTSTSTPTAASPTAAHITATATMQPAQPLWSGRIVYTTEGHPQSPSTVVVRVLGQVGLVVELRIGSFRAEGVTGSKPEYGSFACEFGGLPPGMYTVDPQGIDSSVTVNVEQGELVLVEFSPVGVAKTPASPTVTATAAMVLSTPVVQSTPPRFSVLRPSAQFVTSTLTLQAGANLAVSGVVSPSITDESADSEPVWSARVTHRIPGAENSPSTLVVRVLGARNLPVRIRADGWETWASTGTKREHGEFACEFGGLPSGEYEIIPDGMDLSHTVELGPSEFVLVDFTYEAPKALAAPTRPRPSDDDVSPEPSWNGRVVSRTLDLDNDEDWGRVVVQVLDLDALPVEVRSTTDGWSTFKLTEVREGYDGSVCEFVRLTPGMYQVVPEGIGTWVELDVTRGSLTWVEFASR